MKIAESKSSAIFNLTPWEGMIMISANKADILLFDIIRKLAIDRMYIFVQIGTQKQKMVNLGRLYYCNNY